MTQASVNIAQQFQAGGVIPADLVGQSAVSKKYVDDQLAIRDANISAAAGAASAAQADIDAHEASPTAHPAQNITYSGEAQGANVKQALDLIDTRIDNLVLNTGNSNPEIVDARGTYPVLRARLDASDAQLAEKPNKKETQSITLYAKAFDDTKILPYSALTQTIEGIQNRKTLNVAFWGDSITEAVNTGLYNYEDGYAYVVKRQIENLLNPLSITTHIQDFGLGSRTISEAADPNYKALASEPPDPTQGFYRPWSVVGKSWRDHIRDYDPDLVVIAFGMNDFTVANAVSMFEANLNSIIDYTKTWSKRPDIVIVPTILPTKKVPFYAESQGIINAIARCARAYAKDNGYIVADANRFWRILRDGVDEGTTTSDQELNFYDFPSGWSGTSDFILTNGVLTPANANNKELTRNRLFYNGYVEVDINPQTADATGSSQIVLRSSNNVALKVLVFAGESGEIQLYVNTTLITGVGSLNIPVGSYSRIKVELNESLINVYLGGNLILTQKNRWVMQDGNIQFVCGSNSPTYTNLNICYGDATKLDPVYSDDQLLGVGGINHPTSFGHAVSYVSAFTGLIKALGDITLGRDESTGNLIITSNIGSDFSTVFRRGKTANVNINVSLSVTASTTGAEFVIASLPAGYYPKYPITGYTNVVDGSLNSITALISINTNGEIKLFANASCANRSLKFYASYETA